LVVPTERKAIRINETIRFFDCLKLKLLNIIQASIKRNILVEYLYEIDERRAKHEE
tara:strand:+ start:31 stop:198 length:168 start_codon:yes stop_codon:yes gene_type:complete